MPVTVRIRSNEDGPLREFIRLEGGRLEAGETMVMEEHRLEYHLSTGTPLERVPEGEEVKAAKARSKARAAKTKPTTSGDPLA